MHRHNLLQSTPVASLRVLIFSSVLLCLTGCGIGGKGPTSDPLRAGESLNIALEAWKAGIGTEELSNREPSIVVIDPDWNSGVGLIDFEPFDSPRQSGFDIVMPVRLTLKTSKGRKIQRTAVYTISTDPNYLIIREEG